MSYYYKSNMNFTSHALQRARERLKLKNNPEWEVKEKIIQHIRTSVRDFNINNFAYVAASNTNIYFVIDTNTNTIITITEMSANKISSLLEKL